MRKLIITTPLPNVPAECFRELRDRGPIISCTTPRPLWRWWLFCAALQVWLRFRWGWLSRVYAWCVLPEWLGWTNE